MLLYSTYLTILNSLKAATPFQHFDTQRVFSNSTAAPYLAGSLSGGLIGAVFAPYGYLRHRHPDASHINLQHLQQARYNWHTLFGGFRLNVFKSASSYSVFFGTFELCKGPLWNTIMRGTLNVGQRNEFPFTLLWPLSMLMAGSAASFLYAMVSVPLNKIIQLHYNTLDAIGNESHRSSYRKTLQNLLHVSRHSGGLHRYLYGHFLIFLRRHLPGSRQETQIFIVPNKLVLHW